MLRRSSYAIYIYYYNSISSIKYHIDSISIIILL
nr:MAG TPA: hypothetical protein [Caudoviricetes sp.]